MSNVIKFERTVKRDVKKASNKTLIDAWESWDGFSCDPATKYDWSKGFYIVEIMEELNARGLGHKCAV